MAGRNPSPDLFETSTSDTDTSDSDKTLSPPPDCLPPWMRSSSETYSAQTPLAPLEPVITISSESESEKLTNIQKASLGACKSDSDSDSEELCFGSPLKTPPKRPPRPPLKKKTTTPSYTDLEREVARQKIQIERLKIKNNQLEGQLLKKTRANDELKKRVHDLETTLQKRKF